MASTGIMDAKPIHDQVAKDRLYEDLPGKVAEALKCGRPLMHKCESCIPL
jgi:hypothetical protein